MRAKTRRAAPGTARPLNRLPTRPRIHPPRDFFNRRYSDARAVGEILCVVLVNALAAAQRGGHR